MTVLELRSGAPARMRFETPMPLDNPLLEIREWKDGAYRRLVLPSEGESKELAAVGGPFQ